MAAMTINQRVDAQEKELARLLDWIRQIDTKVGVFATLGVSLLGVLTVLFTNLEDADVYYWIAYLSTAVSLLISLVCCYKAVVPQVDGPKGSFIFFGGIARRQAQDYESEVNSRTIEKYLGDLDAQCYVNATIAWSKYRYLTNTVKWTSVSFVLWLVSISSFYGIS